MNNIIKHALLIIVHKHALLINVLLIRCVALLFNLPARLILKSSSALFYVTIKPHHICPGKLEEIETQVKAKQTAALAALQNKNASLEEQLENESK